MYREISKLVIYRELEPDCILLRLAEICRDYLYVKTLRNVTNHANDDITEKQKDVIRYLTGFDGYVHPRDVTRRDIRRFLLRAMERLEPGPGERN